MENTHTSPISVGNRLLNNRLAVIGIIIIVFAHILAGLGYLVIPDGTTNANEGDIAIRQKHPFFTTKILYMKKGVEVESQNLFKVIFSGKEQEYTFQAINNYEIKEDSVYFTVFTNPIPIKEALLNVVRAVNRDMPVEKIEGETEDSFVYYTPEKQKHEVSVSQLVEEFKKFNVEERTYYLGTDNSGRDVLSRVVLGLRISLSIGFVVVVISLLVGISLGALAGFFGGKSDSFISWLMTVVWSVPSVMLVIIISMSLNVKNIWVVFVAVGLTMWVDVARTVRGEIMVIKQKLYIDAAKAFGLRDFYIIYKHILPNITGSLVVLASSNFAFAIITETGLSFLGLSVQDPVPSLGGLIKQGQEFIINPEKLHLVLAPSLVITILVFAFNLLGNGLRDAYSPQSHQQ